MIKICPKCGLEGHDRLWCSYDEQSAPSPTPGKVREWSDGDIYWTIENGDPGPSSFVEWSVYDQLQADASKLVDALERAYDLLGELSIPDRQYATVTNAASALAEWRKKYE